MNASWDDHRYFLAIARAGSLTEAAKVLAVSQPTVSRRLDAMEQKLGVRLFRRTRRGYQLTENGAHLFQTVVRVEEQLLEADRNLVGRDTEMAGTLRFTSTENLINGFLGPHLGLSARTRTSRLTFWRATPRSIFTGAKRISRFASLRRRRRR